MRDAPAVTDLVTQATNGDKPAWDALVDRYTPLIWAICQRHRLSRAGASDVGQAARLGERHHFRSGQQDARLSRRTRIDQVPYTILHRHLPSRFPIGRGPLWLDHFRLRTMQAESALPVRVPKKRDAYRRRQQRFLRVTLTHHIFVFIQRRPVNKLGILQPFHSNRSLRKRAQPLQILRV